MLAGADPLRLTARLRALWHAAPPQEGGRMAAAYRQLQASTLQLPARGVTASAVAAPSRADPDLAPYQGSRSDAVIVQWYPGHIARAERRLREQLKAVDVVIEVRDGRIPQSTCHPSVPEWTSTKSRLLVLNRSDQVSEQDRQAWSRHLRGRGESPYWTDGKAGTGVRQLKKAAQQASAAINERRRAKGLLPRPVRAVVVGFPNVGKSALINRLLNSGPKRVAALLRRRLCESAPKPGVTRDLRWLRVGGDLDLLDSPGIIPTSLRDQTAALRLAMCNDIGEAAYDAPAVAAALVETLCGLPAGPAVRAALRTRFQVDMDGGMTGEDCVAAVAERLFHGELEKAGQRLLKDYRTCRLGELSLELPAGCL